MTSAAKHPDKDVTNNIQIPQCQITLVQLPIPETFIDNPSNRVFDPGHIWFADSPDCRFAAVRQHDQRCFPGLRLRPLIAKILFNNALAMLALRCLFIKIGNQGGSMVLAHDVRDHFRQFILPAKFQTIPNVCGDNHCGKAW